MKLIRNHFIDDGFVINGKFVKADIIAALLEKTSGDLSITHKINLKHIMLTKCERQKVKMATKLFSNTVAQAITRAASLGYLNGKNWNECHELLKTVSVLKVLNVSYCICLYMYLRQTNDWFDVLNVRVPRADSRERIQAYGISIDVQNDILDKMSNMVLNMKVGNKSSLLPFQKGKQMRIAVNLGYCC